MEPPTSWSLGLVLLPKPPACSGPVLPRSPDLPLAHSRQETGPAALGPRRNSLRAEAARREEAECSPHAAGPLAQHPLAGWLQKQESVWGPGPLCPLPVTDG